MFFVHNKLFYSNVIRIEVVERLGQIDGFAPEISRRRHFTNRPFLDIKFSEPIGQISANYPAVPIFQSILSRGAALS